jgi:hypothetical protein
MEITPLSGIFLCLFGVLLCWWIGLVVLILYVFALSFVLWVGAALSWIFLCGVLLAANPFFFYFSQKAAYTPYGIMTNLVALC